MASLSSSSCLAAAARRIVLASRYAVINRQRQSDAVFRPIKVAPNFAAQVRWKTPTGASTPGASGATSAAAQAPEAKPKRRSRKNPDPVAASVVPPLHRRAPVRLPSGLTELLEPAGKRDEGFPAPHRMSRIVRRTYQAGADIDVRVFNKFVKLLKEF